MALDPRLIARLERERRKRIRAETESLLEFIPRYTPNYVSPVHLAPLAAKIEQAITEPVRVISAVPPRHAKTETIINGIAYILRKRPELTIGYATYSTKLARSKSDKARALARRCGVNLSESVANLEEWRTTAGGGLIAQGVQGMWTGQGVNILFVDDPVKDRADAESKTMQERTFDFYRDVAYTRLEPGGSVFVNATRWHKDDLSGKLLRESREGNGDKFDEVIFPAIDRETGLPLWPERYDLAALNRIRSVVGPYGWESLYMQNPRPRGGTVFEGVALYDRLPRGGFRVGIGVDLAYTAKKRADHSVIVIMLEFDREPGTYYVFDVIRKQVRAPDFVRELKRARADFPGAKMLFRYGGGGERGVVDLLPALGVKGLEAEATVGDKFQNAQELAAAWNVDPKIPGDTARILLPRTTCGDDCPSDCEEHPAPDWVEPYIDEVLEFTGADGDTDDQVDASVSAHRALKRRPIGIATVSSGG